MAHDYDKAKQRQGGDSFSPEFVGATPLVAQRATAEDLHLH